MLGGQETPDDPSDQLLEFDLVASYNDGTSLNGSISIGLNQDDDPTVIGIDAVTAASDTLIGTSGADTFEWSLADQNSEGDVIKNFDATEDAIDLGDLISDSVADEDLANYISVTPTANSDNTGTDTVIEVKNADGDTIQTITVEGVNLTDVNGDGTADDLTTLLTQLRNGSVIDPDSGG